MAFICLPILFGFPTILSADGDQTPRLCPRCNNASVTSAKSRLWFEFFFIPLIPLNSKRVWVCNICQWRVPVQPNWEPAIMTHQPPPLPPPHPSYQPGYVTQPK